MTIRSRTTGAALVLVLSLGGTLAACGGSDSSDGADAAATTAAPEATTDEPTAAEPEATTDAGDGDKPSREDVIAGYTKVITSSGATGLPEDLVDKVVTCFVDELYDTASTKTLQAIADAQPAGVDPADAQLFGDASTTCTAKVAG